MRLLFAALALILAAAPAAADAPSLAAREQADVAAMLAGVRTLAMPGVPGTLAVLGPSAFPVVAAESGGRPAPLVGATRLGRGRAVLFGHGYFDAALAVGDTSTFVRNVAAWVANKPKARIGVRRFRGVRALLAKAGHEVVDLDAAAWTDTLGSLDAAFLPLADVTDDERVVVARRLKAGLGVVAGMPGWGWQQLNPAASLAEDNQANRLLAPAGLVWGGEFMKKPKGGRLTVRGPAPALTHAGLALDALIAAEGGGGALGKADSALAVATVTRAIRAAPTRDKLLLPRLGRLLRHAEGTRRVPRADAPLTDAQGLGKLLLTLQLQQLALLPPTKVKAHPAAAHFPGAVDARAKRVTRRLDIDRTVPGWHSTGLYAAPGDVLTVIADEAAVTGRLAVRIGCHKDKLWGKARWSRVPEITVERPLDAKRTQHACAFGGPVYVVAPKGGRGRAGVEIRGAVAAPRFVLGTTTNAAWRATERAHPAPWAELETAKVIITVPSEHVRALDDPEALMTWWDRVMDGCADLAARPPVRARPERYVADVQISAGYMHAGYPIMTHLDAAPRFVDLGTLSEKGDWGMFHEMGHNHQHGDWTFQGTTEVTCNLFSLYLMETVCRKGIGHEAMSARSIAKNTRAYEKGGRAFGLWKSKPFTALIMYQQLRTAFGWDAYKRVFATYRDLPARERPKTDAEKRDQWMVRMSRAVGRDLGPFFVAWGIPVSDKARASITDLPAWMPDDGMPRED